MVFGAIDLHIGAEQRPLTDANRRRIENGAAGIEERAVAEEDVEAVGAVERRLDPRALARASKQRPQAWPEISTLSRRERIVLEQSVARDDAQRLQFVIQARIPFARRHFRAFTLCHGGVSCLCVVFRCFTKVQSAPIREAPTRLWSNVRPMLACAGRAVPALASRGSIMLYLLALLIGVIAGLRAMTAPAAVAWARLSRLAAARRHLAGLHGPLGRRASSPSWPWSNWSPTSCRRRRAAKCRMQFGARIVTGGLRRRGDRARPAAPRRRAHRRRHRRGDRHAMAAPRRAAGWPLRSARIRPPPSSRTRWRSSAACSSWRPWHDARRPSTPSSSAPARPALRSPAG